MKKFILISLLILMATATASAAPMQNDDGAYVIESAEDLKWFRKSVGDGMTELNAVLSGDIDLGGQSWHPIGDSKDRAYNGYFDGRGYSVRGLSIRGEDRFLGLFGYLDINGVVSNLIVENAAIESVGDSGTSIGVIAGYSKGIIESCTVIKSSVRVKSAINRPEPIHAGGIAGFNDDGIIIACISLQNKIDVFDETVDQREVAAGGICGMNIGLKQRVGLIIDCESRANEVIITTGNNNIGSYGGGIVGVTLSGMIRRCSTYGGKVLNQAKGDSLSALGGILGASMRGSYIENCLVDGDILIRSDGGADLSYLGALSGSLIMSNVSECIVKNVIISAAEGAPHSIGGISGSFSGGKISDCRVASIIMPKNLDKANFQGAVTGVLFASGRDGPGLMMVENTWFHKSVANGLAIGINHTQATIDAKSFGDTSPPGMQ